MPETEYKRRNVKVDITPGGLLMMILIIYVAVFGVIASIRLATNIFDDRPMPCAEHEVYVWQDYPNTAQCLSDTDHQGHMGGHG